MSGSVRKSISLSRVSRALTGDFALGARGVRPLWRG